MAINNSLQNAVTALNANQLRMATSSNNVANASTEGYSRQRLEAGFRPDNIQGDTRFGSGVEAGNVQRMVSDYLVRSEVDQAARLGGTELRAELGGRLDNMFSESEGTGIAGGMEQLFASVNDLANNPTGAAERSQVLQSGEQLSTALNQRDQRMQDLQLEVDRRVTDKVDEINRDLAEIADLNGRIQEAEAATDGEALRMRDERDLLTKELAEKVGINYHETSQGSYNIQLKGGGHSLVQGGEHYELQRGGNNQSTAPSSGSSGFETFAGIQLQERTQVDLTADLQEGKGQLGEMLTMRDDTVVDLRNRLDNMARSVVEEVNKVHSEGTGLNYQDSATGTYAVNDASKEIGDATNGLPSGDLFQAGDLKLALHNKSTDEVEMVTARFNGDESLDQAVTKINQAVSDAAGAAGAPAWLNNALQANNNGGRLELTTTANVDYGVQGGDDPFSELQAQLAGGTVSSGDGQLRVRMIAPDGSSRTEVADYDNGDDASQLASDLSSQLPHMEVTADGDRLSMNAVDGYQFQIEKDTASLLDDDLDKPGLRQWQGDLDSGTFSGSDSVDLRVFNPDGSSQLATVSYDDSADYDNDGNTGDTSDLVAALNSQLDKVSASNPSGDKITLEADTGHRFAIENDPGNLFGGEVTKDSDQTVAMERGSSNLFAATGVNNFFTMKNGTEAAHQTGPFDTIRSAEGLASANQALNLAGDFTLSDAGSSKTVNVSPGDSLNDLASAINGPGLGITASVNNDNQLKLDAAAGQAITFEEDTAGVMDRLGLAEGNSAATEIAVDPAVADSPKRVAAGYLGERLDDQGNRVGDSNDDPVYELGVNNNQAANEWADLRDAKLEIADNPEEPTVTFAEHYAGTVGTAGTEKATADSLQEHQRNVMDQINNQREQHSGVNIDEEMTDMLNFQRGYQAASKVISTADEMFGSLLQSV